MTHEFYPCPKCGKPDSSWTGDTYCGSCEEAFAKECEEFGDFRTESEMLKYYASLNE